MERVKSQNGSLGGGIAEQAGIALVGVDGRGVDDGTTGCM